MVNSGYRVDIQYTVPCIWYLSYVILDVSSGGNGLATERHFGTLYTHLSNTISERKVHIRIRQGAKPALEKLHKYREKALNNQFYKLGTGESAYQYGTTLLKRRYSPSPLSPHRMVQKFGPEIQRKGSTRSS